MYIFNCSDFPELHFADSFEIFFKSGETARIFHFKEGNTIYITLAQSIFWNLKGIQDNRGR
jgi:hypothetical protein